jgi:DNA polymerase-3 subunit alpha
VKVKCIEDLVLVNALYRPATINSGYVRQYLENRADPKQVSYIHHLFEAAFGKTLGVPVYQEQVLDLLRLLGMQTHELNSMLKAIKASNNKSVAAANTFDETEELFKRLCRDAGMTAAVANEAWEAIKQFSDYSFNRAHSVEYAMRGYHMAYLKVHYPLEFHAALLEMVSRSGGGTQKEKEPIYMREARRYNIRLLPPDVQISNEHWTIDRQAKAIRRGLTSIHGIAGATASAIVNARPFGSLSDMLEKAAEHGGRALAGGKDYLETGNYSGVVLKLKNAGALASLGIPREV